MLSTQALTQAFVTYYWLGKDLYDVIVSSQRIVNGLYLLHYSIKPKLNHYFTLITGSLEVVTFSLLWSVGVYTGVKLEENIREPFIIWGHKNIENIPRNHQTTFVGLYSIDFFIYLYQYPGIFPESYEKHIFDMFFCVKYLLQVLSWPMVGKQLGQYKK